MFRCFKDATEPSTWPVYRCLNAEIDLAGRKYVLNDSDWYNVDGNYVKDIEAFYSSIPDSKLSLPQFGTKTEPEYLDGLKNTHTQFAVMDRKLIMTGSGKSRIEFCDIYSKKKDIIHVKQYGGSSVLSHLFSQALVSAECLLYEQSFRESVQEILPAGFKFSDPKKTPNANEHTVCIAIMSKVKGPLEIPFFSKVQHEACRQSAQQNGLQGQETKNRALARNPSREKNAVLLRQVRHGVFTRQRF